MWRIKNFLNPNGQLSIQLFHNDNFVCERFFGENLDEILNYLDYLAQTYPDLTLACKRVEWETCLVFQGAANLAIFK